MMGMSLSLLCWCQCLDCDFVFTTVNIILQTVITEGNWINGTWGLFCVLFYYFTLIHNYFRT